MKTNREFARTDAAFLSACRRVQDRDGKSLSPTTRQASKFRSGKGIAYKTLMKTA